MSTAENVVDQHGEAINQRDVAIYLDATNFPFTYQNYNGVALTVETAEEYENVAAWPWDIILSSDPTWHHTKFHAIDEVARSESSAVFKLTFSRMDASDHADGTYQAIWIATRQGDHWGVQFRHNLGATDA